MNQYHHGLWNLEFNWNWIEKDLESKSLVQNDKDSPQKEI